jgi:N4-gp56 family major capsid protein
MADTTPATGLTPQQWDDKFFVQYFQEGPFKPLMGKSENSVIQVKENLTKGKGDTITIALVNKLTNAPTTGTNVLEGNEEDMASRSHDITIDKRRNAVRIAEMSEQTSAIDLREAGKTTLMNWATEFTRDYFIEQLGTLNGTTFLTRTAAIGDAWLVDNVDRVYFGAGVGSGTDLSADLGQLDTTNDLFNVTALDGMILKAKTSNPKIRPMRDAGNSKRYYVVLANPNAFKNLRDSMIDASGNNSLIHTCIEQENSTLFEGGDLHWNGAIVKEVDDMPIYPNIGNGGTVEVTPVYLLGAQALGFVWGRRWKTITKEFDYGDKHGIAVDGIFGISKLRFGTGAGDTDDSKDHGVVTGFFATTGSPTVASAAEL